MRVAQVTFFAVQGTRSRLYRGRKYDAQEGPCASRAWMDFLPSGGPNKDA